MSHDNHAGAVTNPFSEAEWEALRLEDKGAAVAIVGLMVSIFVAGVLGYLVVCYWVA